MKKTFLLFVIGLSASLSLTAADASKVAATSNWLKITSDVPQSANEEKVGRPNETYLSVQLLAGVMNANDGWWTQFIETNDNVGLVASVTADSSAPQAVFSDFEKVQSRQNFQFSTNKFIVHEQPLGKPSIGVQLSLVATADDGVASMLTQLKTVLPTVGFGTSASTALAAVGVGKTVVDALLGKDLLKTGLKSDYQVGIIETGTYVILASKNQSAYGTITGDLLQWKNGTLSYLEAGKPLPTNVSYVVVRVAHTKRRYPAVTDVLHDSSSEWSKVYRQIDTIITPIVLGYPSAAKVAAMKKQLQDQDAQLTALAAKAETLIQIDNSLTQSEKDDVAGATGMMVTYFSQRIVDTIAKLDQELKMDASLTVAATSSSGDFHSASASNKHPPAAGDDPQQLVSDGLRALSSVKKTLRAVSFERDK